MRNCFITRAGIYSSGLKIFEDGVHEPLSRWLRMKPGGECDARELVHRLDTLDSVPGEATES